MPDDPTHEYSAMEGGLRVGIRVGRILFSDLDGTLLDHHTYAFEAARPALARLKEQGIPLILVSSKTRAEMEKIRADLNLDTPFVVENGAAVLIPLDSSLPRNPLETRIPGYRRILLGRPRSEIVPLFDQLAGKYALKPISRMPLEEVTARTGLERRRAEAACQREYGEAFFWDDPRPDVGGLTRDADALGLQWTKGGRCHHLLAGNDKGRAVRLLAGLHRSLVPDLVTAAVGDAANDEPMLAAVDHPYLVAQPHNGHADLAVPGLIRVPFPGPDGFRWSVDHWLETCR